MMLAAGYDPYSGAFTICFWKEAIRVSMLRDEANERLVLEYMGIIGSSSLALFVAVLGLTAC